MISRNDQIIVLTVKSFISRSGVVFGNGRRRIIVQHCQVVHPDIIFRDGVISRIQYVNSTGSRELKANGNLGTDSKITRYQIILKRRNIEINNTNISPDSRVTDFGCLIGISLIKTISRLIDIKLSAGLLFQ